jgi:hypothetical protein
VFELQVRYIEGAPVDWRSWLTPGVPVTLRFLEAGIAIASEFGSASIAWASLAYLSARGPDDPQPNVNSWEVGLPIRGIVNRVAGKVSYCWLALGYMGGEVIFEADGILRQELEDLLARHAG